MRYKLVLLICCLAVAVSSAGAAVPSEAIFPIFVFSSVPPQHCRAWSSIFLVYNPHPTLTTLDFKAFDSTGKALESASLTVSPYTTRSPNFLVTGVAWAKVTSSDSVIIDEILQ